MATATEVEGSREVTYEVKRMVIVTDFEGAHADTFPVAGDTGGTPGGTYITDQTFTGHSLPDCTKAQALEHKTLTRKLVRATFIGSRTWA